MLKLCRINGLKLQSTIFNLQNGDWYIDLERLLARHIHRSRKPSHMFHNFCTRWTLQSLLLVAITINLGIIEPSNADIAELMITWPDSFETKLVC
jgi:hypothetical protein